MRDEDNSRTAQKVPRYKLVVDLLRNIDTFTTVEDLAAELKMDKQKFTACIKRAKTELAKEKMMLVNKLGEGYKIGNFLEFVDEVDKACKRSFANISSMAKLISELKASGLEADFNFIESVIHKNLRNIEVLFDPPDINEFESYDEYKDAADNFYSSNQIIPDKLSTIPDELVDPENPDPM